MDSSRRLAAIMFTDIVGYTALMQTDEKKGVEMRKRHRKIFEATTKQFRGHILQYYGDGTLSIFDSVVDAVKCGSDMQMQFQKEPVVPVRIGVHLGDIIVREDEVIGDAVNVASRIESMAVVGSVLVSDRVQRDLKNHKNIDTQSLGIFELKNVSQPVEVFALSSMGLVIPEVNQISEKAKPLHPGVETNMSNYTNSRDAAKSIAILPFVNMSNDPDQDYFCDGLTEELLSVLSQLDKFKVAARTSSFFFKGKNLDISEVARKLRVETVLEGSVRKSQNRIRITAQLVNAQDGFHLWSERYDRELTDIFDIQDEIALAILDALRLKLLGKEKARLIKRSTKNPEAYQLYLKGRQNFHLTTPDGYLKAIEFYNAAIKIETTYSEAIAGVASCYLNLWHFDILPADQSLPHMIKATHKSMEIDDQIAESHLAMARLRMWYEFDMKAAEKEFEKTLDINPNIPDAISHYGFVESFLGSKSKALELGKKAIELDPFSPMTNLNNGVIYWLNQDFSALKEQSNRTIDFYPNFWGGHYLLGLYYWSKQEYIKAIQSFDTSLKMQPSIWLLSILGSLYGIIGEKDKAHSMVAKMDEITKKEQMASFSYALVYAGLGDMDKTFDYLEKASEERTGLLIFLDVGIRKYKWIPAFTNNTRLQKFIRRAGIPQVKT